MSAPITSPIHPTICTSHSLTPPLIAASISTGILTGAGAGRTPSSRLPKMTMDSNFSVYRRTLTQQQDNTVSHAGIPQRSIVRRCRSFLWSFIRIKIIIQCCCCGSVSASDKYASLPQLKSIDPSEGTAGLSGKQKKSFFTLLARYQSGMFGALHTQRGRKLLT